MKIKFFLSSEEKKPTTYVDVMASNINNNTNVCTHFTLGSCSCTPTTINDTQQEAFDPFNGARKRKFEEKETNDQRKKKPTTYVDVMASNNNTNTNVCTHFTLGCCSCTSTIEAIDSFSGTRKRKFCEKETTDQRKKTKNNEVVETILSWGYSTELMLYDDPWKIKKVLQKSDLGNLSRLLLSTELVEKLVLPVLGIANNLDAIRDGIQVRVFDLDTKSMHTLVFKKWFSSGSYVFMGKWVKEFVARRGLEEGDQIGLHWDPYNHHFNFSLLQCNQSVKTRRTSSSVV